MSGIKPQIKRYLQSGAVLVCVMALLAACGGTTPNNSSGTASAKSCPHPVSLKQLNFGIIPGEAQTSIVDKLKPFADALSKQICVPVNTSTGTNYTAVITAMANNKVDMADFGPLSYVLAQQKGGARAVAITKTQGTNATTYKSYIITTPKSGIKKVTDLKGKSFSFVDPASTSGNLEPRYMMTKAGLNPDTDVKGSYLGTHDASLLAVISGKVDAGAVASSTYNSLMKEGKFKSNQLVIVDQSDAIPNDPIAVGKNVSQKDAQSLEAALEALNSDSAALNAYGTGGFSKTTDSTYEGIRQLAKTLNLDLEKVAG